MVLDADLNNLSIAPEEFIITTYEILEHENVSPSFKTNVIQLFNDNVDENKLSFPANAMAMLLRYYINNSNAMTKREKELLERVLLNARIINPNTPSTLYEFLRTLTLIVSGEKVSEGFKELILKISDMARDFISTL